MFPTIARVARKEILMKALYRKRNAREHVPTCSHRQRHTFADQPFPAAPNAVLSLMPFIDWPKTIQGCKRARLAGAEREGASKGYRNKLPAQVTGTRTRAYCLQNAHFNFRAAKDMSLSAEHVAGTRRWARWREAKGGRSVDTTQSKLHGRPVRALFPSRDVQRAECETIQQRSGQYPDEGE